MSVEHFFNIEKTDGGMRRELAPGITTTIFSGEQAMISIVRFLPNACGALHHHPEEQWGYCVSGSGIRVQGENEIKVKPGDFWRTPGNMPHTLRAGKDGLTVMDVFAPPRREYAKEGSGFAASEE